METSGNHKPQQGPEQLLLADAGVAADLRKHRQDPFNGDHSPLLRIAIALERLADHLAPEPQDIVGTNYVAGKMGCTPTHVARMTRDGEIPISCVAPGCGDGRPWRFRRARIDNWLETR